MTSIRDLINRLDEIQSSPSAGDGFFLELGENIEIETEILEIDSNGDIVLLGDSKLISILEDLNKIEEKKLTEDFDLVSALPYLSKTPVIAGVSTFFQTLLSPSNNYPYGATNSPPDRAYSDAIMAGKSSEEAIKIWNAVNDEMQQQIKMGAKSDPIRGDFTPAPETIPPTTGIGKADTPVSTNKTIDKPTASKISKISQFTSAKQAYDVLSQTVGNLYSPEKISQLSSIIQKYALPGIAVAAMLYGGKKLYDYLSNNSEKTVSEKINVPTVNYQGGDGMSSIYTKVTNNPFSKGTETLADKLKQTINGASQTLKQKTTINNLDNNTQSIRSLRSTSTVKESDREEFNEAKYQGRSVPLGKPMRGDVKKFKVYVRDPKTGNIKKVNFGDKTMRIKKSNPKRRKSFRARHNCANPGPRTKARYWSCRKW
jgi:hypothetical protein